MRNAPKVFPTFKKDFPYMRSKLGLLSSKPVKGINKLLNNSQETIFHHEVKFCNDSDYSDVLIAIIKMGGNVSLKDIYSKKPLDYITSSETINDVLDNLNTTLTHYKKDDSIIGLRLQRAKIELLDGNERKYATTEYILRLQKCINKLLSVNDEDFKNNLSLLDQFLFKEYDESLKNDVHTVIINFLKEDTSPNFDNKLNSFITIANRADLKTFKIALLDIAYTKAKSLEKQLGFLKTMALNYYPNDTLHQQILDRYQSLKDKIHSDDKNIKQLNDLEKILKIKKLYDIKEYVEPEWKEPSSTPSNVKKHEKQIKPTTISKKQKLRKVVEANKDVKNTISFVPREVYGTEKFVNSLKKLSPEVQDGINKCIDALSSGDTSGLNDHALSNARVGQYAIDVKGTGHGRGAGRLIYTTDKKNNSINIQEFLPKHNY